MLLYTCPLYNVADVTGRTRSYKQWIILDSSVKMVLFDLKLVLFTIEVEVLKLF